MAPVVGTLVVGPRPVNGDVIAPVAGSIDTSFQRRSKRVRTRVRRLVRRAPLLSRTPSAASRADPNYIVIGFHKCGTSSLHAELVQHAQIEPGHRKEVHYFESRRFRWIPYSFYRAHFPLRSELAPGPSSAAKITGEATPGYVYSRRAAERMHRRLPSVRLLVVIRDPTQRAISHYYHEQRMGREARPIEVALRASMSTPSSVESGGDTWLDRRQYAARGLFARSLAYWYDLFSDEHILVISLEHLVDARTHTMAMVYEFLGIDPVCNERPFPRENVSPRSDFEPALLAELDEYYRVPNRELTRMLRRHQPDRPLPPWLDDSDDD